MFVGRALDLVIRDAEFIQYSGQYRYSLTHDGAVSQEIDCRLRMRSMVLSAECHC